MNSHRRIVSIAGTVFIVLTGFCAPSATRAATVGMHDFASRCKAANALLCLALDSDQEVDRYRSTPSHIAAGDWIQWDPTMHAARFTIPPRSPADSSGMLDIHFPKPLDDVFVSFDVRYPSAFLSYRFRGGGGWKMFILGQGSEGCAPYEVVGNDQYYRGFPAFYYLCSVFEPIQKQNPLDDDINQFDLQPGGDTQCLRTGPNRGKPCAEFVGNRWVTYQVHVDSHSKHFEVWQTVAGVTLKIIDYDLRKLPIMPVSYDWIKLTPYNTGKDSEEDHPKFHIWYRRVIVAPQKILPPRGDQ